ncbi:MAG: hypothetical protein JKP98_19815 [Rhodobacteraceae bacterium]|nr:hypothetical protein [Paracoccaceae bacterium]
MPTPTRRPFAALLISAFLALPAIAQTDPPATPADRVVASVGGTEITSVMWPPRSRSCPSSTRRCPMRCCSNWSPTS